MKKFILFTLALVGSIGVWGVDVIQNVRTSTKYSSISTAISQAQQDDELKFLCDKEMGAGGVTISKRIKLNLNGKTITGLGNTSEQDYIFVVSSGINVDGSKKVEIYGGTINPSDNNHAIYSYSPIYIHDINITATSTKENAAIMIKANNSQVKKCTITTYSGCGGLYISYNNKVTPNILGYMTVDSCDVFIHDYNNGNSTCVTASRGSTAVINSGNYTSEGACIFNTTSGGATNIFGGTFKCTNTKLPSTGAQAGFYYSGVIYVDEKGTVNVNGGSFDGYLFTKPTTNNSYLNIYNGTFSCDANPNYSGKVISFASGSYTESSCKKTISNFVKGDNEFVQDENGKYIAAPKAAPSGVYSRTVTSGSWGTICLPNDVAKGNFSGADFFMINGKQTTGGQTQIVLDQVESLEKGKPYFFQATGTTLSCTVTASSEIVSAQNINGLYGTLLGINWDATHSTHASETDVTLSNASALLLSSGELKSSIAGSALAPNRAYVVLADVPEYNPSAPVSGRRMVMSVDGKGAPNAMDEVEVEAMQTQKVIVDGKLYIRRGNQWFDAQGALVK